MKISILLLSATILSVSGLAHAKPDYKIAPVQTCSNEGGDGGFRIDDRASIAELFENNIAGEIEIATLKCKAAPSQGPTHPDGETTHKICRGKGKDGKSYSASFKSGGFAGLSWAMLSLDKETSVRLSCKFNPQ